MSRQLSLFDEYPKYNEFLDLYCNKNDCANIIIRHLFIKHCGRHGELFPLSDNVKDRILQDLENYGGFGSMEDYQYRKYIFKQIVNMYWFVLDQPDNIIPVNHWTMCISI